MKNFIENLNKNLLKEIFCKYSDFQFNIKFDEIFELQTSEKFQEKQEGNKIISILPEISNKIEAEKIKTLKIQDHTIIVEKNLIPLFFKEDNNINHLENIQKYENEIFLNKKKTLLNFENFTITKNNINVNNINENKCLIKSFAELNKEKIRLLISNNSKNEKHKNYNNQINEEFSMMKFGQIEKKNFESSQNFLNTTNNNLIFHKKK